MRADYHEGDRPDPEAAAWNKPARLEEKFSEGVASSVGVATGT
jgi:hypothetical protein